MEDNLQQFLDKAFAPYGDFPARHDVMSELLEHLRDKYQDFKKEGLSDKAAYDATISSFGNVEEIMEQLPHEEKRAEKDVRQESSVRKALKETFKQAKASMGISKFAGVDMQ